MDIVRWAPRRMSPYLLVLSRICMIPYDKSEFFPPLRPCAPLYQLGTSMIQVTLFGPCFPVCDILRRIYSTDHTSLRISVLHPTTDGSRGSYPSYSSTTNHPCLKVKPFYFSGPLSATTTNLLHLRVSQ